MASRTTILNKVKTLCEGVTGVIFVEVGLPVGPVPHTSCPFAYITTTDLGAEDATFGGGSRMQDVKWVANINLVMGPADSEQSRIVAASQPFPSRMRAAFAPDWTLGGLVWDSDLQDAFDNFESYRETGVVPMMRWRLEITEARSTNTPGDFS